MLSMQAANVYEMELHLAFNLLSRPIDIFTTVITTSILSVFPNATHTSLESVLYLWTLATVVIQPAAGNMFTHLRRTFFLKD